MTGQAGQAGGAESVAEWSERFLARVAELERQITLLERFVAVLGERKAQRERDEPVGPQLRLVRGEG